VNVVAMLVYFKLFGKLKQTTLTKKMSPADVLHIAEGIYQNRNTMNETIGQERKNTAGQEFI
jgi:hypothetical protein